VCVLVVLEEPVGHRFFAIYNSLRERSDPREKKAEERGEERRREEKSIYAWQHSIRDINLHKKDISKVKYNRLIKV
jgi:hypothetical protein